MTTKAPGPLALDELWALRTDYEDVPVPQLGDSVLRVYALTGTARAALVGEMTGLAKRAGGLGDFDKIDDPETVRVVMEFQGRVVGAALGYPMEQWDGVGSHIGSAAVEVLYEVAARLSGLDKGEQDKATVRLRPKRKAASGTD